MQKRPLQSASTVYIRNKKDHCHSRVRADINVLTAIIRLRLTAGLWSSIPSIRSAIASLPRAARLLFDRCATARRWRPGRCSPFHAPIPPASSGVRREAVIPRPVVRGPMAVVLPRSRSPVPPPGSSGRATADYVDRPQAALGSRHRQGTALGPAGDCPSPFAPPPAIQL